MNIVDRNISPASFEYIGEIGSEGSERVARQMLAGEFVSGSNWEGLCESERLDEAGGIAVEKELLEYVGSNGLFKTEYGEAFTNASGVLEKSKKFISESVVVSKISEAIEQIAGKLRREVVTYMDAKINLLEHDDFGILKLIEDSTLDGNIKKSLCKAMKVFDEYLVEVAQRWKSQCDRGDTCSELAIQYDDKAKCLKFTAPEIREERRGGRTAYYVGSKSYSYRSGSTFNGLDRERPFEKFLVVFSREKIEQGVQHDAEAIFPSGGDQSNRRFAYIKQCASNSDLWHVQEVNFGQGKSDPKVQSTYCTLSTFGRCLVLDKNRLHHFLSDLHKIRSVNAAEQDCHQQVWDNYFCHNITLEGEDIPWDNVPFSYAGQFGNCAMRGIEGVAEVALLSQLHKISAKKESREGENETSNINKKICNTLIINCYEIVSRIGVLRNYLNKNKNKPTRDSLYLLEIAIKQLGTRMGKFKARMEKYGADAKACYLKDDFFEELTAQFKSLELSVNEHIQSDNAKRILYKQVSGDGLETLSDAEKQKYELGINAEAASSLQALHELASARESWSISLYDKKRLTNFKMIEKGDIAYVISELNEMLTMAKKPSYSRLAARKMMDIIQQLPFETLDLGTEELSAESGAKLMDTLRCCLAVIDDKHHSAFDHFFQPRPYPTDANKDLRWQLHDADMDCDQYELTQAVNAHVVTSIIMFRILSENKNFFNGKGVELLNGKTFNYMQYTNFYSSFSYYPNCQRDANIARSICTYFEKQKDKNIIFDFDKPYDGKGNITELFEENENLKIISWLAEEGNLAGHIYENYLSDQKEDYDLSKADPQKKFSLLALMCSFPQFSYVYESAGQVFSPSILTNNNSQMLNFAKNDVPIIGRVYEKYNQIGAAGHYKIYGANKAKSGGSDENTDSIALFSLFDILSGGILSNGRFALSSDGAIEYSIQPAIVYPLKVGETNTSEKLVSLNSENHIRCTSNQEVQVTRESTFQFANMDGVSEDTKIINFLYHLQSNLDICTAYGQPDDRSDLRSSNPVQKSNYFLMHFMEQMLQHPAQKKVKITDGNRSQEKFISAVEDGRPIEVSAQKNCNELIKAVDVLEEEGLNRFWEYAPTNQINVAAVAMIMHYKSLILRNIIAQKNSNALESAKLLEILKRQMEKIKGLKEATSKMGKRDINIKYFIAIMENECILNMLELSGADSEDTVCGNDMDLRYIEKIIVNSHLLKSFNAQYLPRGCLYAKNDAHMLLEPYWAKDGSVAKIIAEKLVESLGIELKEFEESGENNNTIFTSKDKRISVDILNLIVLVNGRPVTKCTKNFNDCGDVLRLFGDRQLEMSQNGNAYFFRNDHLGYVEILETPQNTKVIMCDFNEGENAKKWFYIGSDILNNENFSNYLKCIPQYFQCSDFNIFTDEEGNIRIYDSSIPGTLLYETKEIKINKIDETGEMRTKALKCLHGQNKGSFIALRKIAATSSSEALPESPFKGTQLCRIENEECIGACYNESGQIVRIYFPRLKDSNGEMVSLVPFAEESGRLSWRWSGNKDYRLCSGRNKPIFNSNGLPLKGCEGEIYNPLIAFNNYLCFESGATGNYKYLIPHGEYSHQRGLTHKYDAAFKKCQLGDSRRFWGRERVGEVSSSTNPYMLYDGAMIGNTPLGTLRLAQAFQVQGQYGRAIECLQKLSINGEIGDDEIEAFKEIINFFFMQGGQTPHSANFIFRAIGRMLQCGSSGSEMIKLIDNSDWNWAELLNVYLGGYSTYSTVDAMSINDEIFLFERLKFCLNSNALKRQARHDAMEIIQKHIAVLNEVKAQKLTSPETIQEFTKTYRNGRKIGKCSRSDLHFFMRESNVMYLNINSNLSQNPPQSEENIQLQMKECRVVESSIMKQVKKCFKIKGDGENATGDILEKPSDFSISSGSYRITNEKEDKERCHEFQEGIQAFQKEMNEGEKNQKNKMNDPFMNKDYYANVNQDDLVGFVDNLEINRKKLINTTSKLVQEIGRVLLFDEYFQKLNSGKWGEANVPDVIYNIYGYCIGGKRKRALSCIRKINPTFNAENLDYLIGVCESYIISLTTMRHINKTKAAMDAFMANRNDTTWNAAISLIRAFREPNSCDSECSEAEKHKKVVYQFSLLLEMMSQIRLRPDQIDKIYFIFSTVQSGKGDTFGILIQQLMGSGKSKALMPALILMGLCMKRKRNGNQDAHLGYPIIVSHITQLPAVIKELPPILSQLNLTVKHIDIDFANLRTLNGLRFLRKNLESIFQNRTCVPVFTSSALMALRAFFRSIKSEALDDMEGCLEEYETIMGLFKKCIGIFDEIHLTANPKEAFIVEAYSMGKRNFKHIGPQEVETVSDFMLNYLPEELRIACNSNAQSYIGSDALRAYLKVAMEKKLDAMGILKKLSPAYSNKKDEFIDFMIGVYDGKYQFPERKNSEEECEEESDEAGLDQISDIIKCILDGCKEEERQSIFALRAIASQFIPRCFLRVYNKDFGYDPNTGEVIPYANSQPSKSKFQNPWEIICYSCLSILVDGFFHRTIEDLVVEMYKAAIKAADDEGSLQDTATYAKFRKFFGSCQLHSEPLDLLEIVQHSNENKFCLSQEAVEAIQKYLMTSEGWEAKCELTRKVCIDAAIWNPKSYSTPPSTVIEDLFGGSIGMTGTMFNKNAYPPCMNVNISPQSGGLGAVCAKFIENNEHQLSRIHAVSLKDEDDRPSDGAAGLTAGKLLAQWKKNTESAIKDADGAKKVIQNLRIIVDSGSTLVSQETSCIISDIAKFIKDEELEVSHIEWFDEKAKAFVIAEVSAIASGNFSIKILNDAENQRPRDKSKIFTFLDAGHSVGSDPAMKGDGHGIMTANLNVMEMSGFLQGLTRERRYLEYFGQKMDLIIQKDVLDALGLTGENLDNFFDGKKQEALSIKIIRHLMDNTANDTIRQRAQAVEIQLKELILQAIERWLRYDTTECSCEFNLILRAHFDKFLVNEKLFSLDHWQSVQCWRQTIDGIWSAFTAELKELKATVESFRNLEEVEIPNAFIEIMTEDIKSIEKRAKASVARIPASETFLSPLLQADSTSNFAHDETVEQQKEQEQEQDVQVEIQQQQVQEEKRMDDSRLKRLQKMAAFGGSIGDDQICVSTPIFSKANDSDLEDVYRYLTNSNDGGLQSLGDHFTDIVNCLSNGSWGNDEKKVLGSPFEAFVEFFSKKSFFKSFLFSKNFLKPATFDLSIFHKSRAYADDVLIFWDENCNNIKCVFVAKNDLNELKKLIEEGKIRNCYLSTVSGTPLARHDGLKLNGKVTNFLEDVKWMSFFLNGDIAELQKNEELTYEVFDGDFKFNENYEQIQDFLMLRNGNIGECFKEINHSPVILECIMKSDILLNALADLCNVGEKVEKVSIGALRNKVFDSNEGKITGNVLKAVWKFRKKLMNDDDKLDKLIERITKQCSEDEDRHALICSILLVMKEKQIINLFFQKNKSSIGFLREICTYILREDKSSRINEVRESTMAELLCIYSNKENDSIDLDKFIEIECAAKNGVNFVKVVSSINEIDFDKIPIAQWISNNVFESESDFDEVLFLYMESGNVNKKDAVSVYKAAIDKKDRIVRFIDKLQDVKQKSVRERMNFLLQAHDVILQKNSKRIGIEVSTAIDKMISRGYDGIILHSSECLEEIHTEHEALFRHIVEFSKKKTPNELMKKLLTCDWFNVVEEVTGEKKLFTYDLVVPYVDKDIMKKIIKENINLDIFKLVTFIRESCQHAKCQVDDEDMWEMCVEIKHVDLFSFFLGRATSNFNIDYLSGNHKFVKFFIAYLAKLDAKIFFEILKKNSENDGARRNSYRYDRFIFKIIGSWSLDECIGAGIDSTALFRNMEEIGKLVNEELSRNAITNGFPCAGMGALCLLCASGMPLEDGGMIRWAFASSESKPEYMCNALKGVEINGNFPRIDIMEVLNVVKGIREDTLDYTNAEATYPFIFSYMKQEDTYPKLFFSCVKSLFSDKAHFFEILINYCNKDARGFEEIATYLFDDIHVNLSDSEEEVYRIIIDAERDYPKKVGNIFSHSKHLIEYAIKNKPQDACRFFFCTNYFFNKLNDSDHTYSEDICKAILGEEYNNRPDYRLVRQVLDGLSDMKVPIKQMIDQDPNFIAKLKPLYKSFLEQAIEDESKIAVISNGEMLNLYDCMVVMYNINGNPIAKNASKVWQCIASKISGELLWNRMKEHQLKLIKMITDSIEINSGNAIEILNSILEYISSNENELKYINSLKMMVLYILHKGNSGDFSSDAIKFLQNATSLGNLTISSENMAKIPLDDWIKCIGGKTSNISKLLVNAFYKCAFSDTDVEVKVLKALTKSKAFWGKIEEMVDDLNNNIAEINQVLDLVSSEIGSNNGDAKNLAEKVGEKLLATGDLTNGRALFKSHKAVAKLVIEQYEKGQKHLLFSDWFNPFDVSEYGIDGDYLFSGDRESLTMDEDVTSLQKMLGKCTGNPLQCIAFLNMIFKGRKQDFDKIVSEEFIGTFLAAFAEVSDDNISQILNRIDKQLLRHLLGKDTAGQLLLLKKLCCYFCNGENARGDAKEIYNFFVEIVSDNSLNSKPTAALNLFVEMAKYGDDSTERTELCSALFSKIGKNAILQYAVENINENNAIIDYLFRVRGETSNGILMKICEHLCSEDHHDDIKALKDQRLMVLCILSKNQTKTQWLTDNSCIINGENISIDSPLIKNAQINNIVDIPFSEWHENVGEFNENTEAILVKCGLKDKIKFEQGKGEVTSDEEATSSKCVLIVLGISAAVAILAAISLLVFPFGAGILAAIASLVGMMAAKVLIFVPGAGLLIALAVVFFVRD
ncbi:MAG: hypothetical protein LBI69_00775 [Puniceicoccales bacterium]|jgi:hypothetical protein|nr:hypothetical protein [Puniceicoccales bacterium]